MCNELRHELLSRPIAESGGRPTAGTAHENMSLQAHAQPLLPLDGAPSRPKISRLLRHHVLTACLTGLIQGYDLCVIASILMPVQRELQLCPHCAADNSDAALAHCSCPIKQLAVSACHIGAMVGALFGGLLSDAIGRRTALVGTDICFLFSAALMALASSDVYGQAQFFAGRAIGGLGLGAAGAISSAYIAEIAPAAYRGTLVQLNTFALCSGCLLAYLVSLALGDSMWRWTVAVSLLMAATQLLLLGTLYESPRWLQQRGRLKQAHMAAAALGLTPPAAQKVVANEDHGDKVLGAETAAPRNGNGILHAACRPLLSRANRKQLLLALGIAFAHGASGANAVLYYSRDVLSLAGLASSQARLANAGVGLVKFIGAALSTCAVDRIGRRPLLIGGTLTMALGHLGLGTALGVMSDGSGGLQPLLALASLVIFILAWNLSWAGLMLTMASELLPQEIRGIGCGLAYSVFWLLSFLISSTLETTFELIGTGATFGLYTCATLLALVFVGICVPETNGVALS